MGGVAQSSLAGNWISGRSPLSISFLSQRLSTDKSWNRDVPFAPGSFSKPAPIIGVQRAFAARANRDAATLCHPS